jgi:CheY-like chemotaxis protein
VKSASSKGARPLIVVVDDDTSLLRVLSSILRTSGFQVLTATGGNDAVRICTRFRRPIDALVTDVEMPGLSGFGLAEQMLLTRPAMPVLFMSGSFTGDEYLSCEEGRARRAFLQKPFSGAGLSR